MIFQTLKNQFSKDLSKTKNIFLELLSVQFQTMSIFTDVAKLLDNLRRYEVR